MYIKARQRARKAVAKAKERGSDELAKELESEEGKRKVFKVAKQMARERER